LRRVLAHRPVPDGARRRRSRADGARAGRAPRAVRGGGGARATGPGQAQERRDPRARARRRHRTLLTVLLPHGGTVQMKEGNIKRVFWQTPPLNVPRDWERRTRGLTDQMAAVSVADLMEREKNQGPEA